MLSSRGAAAASFKHDKKDLMFEVMADTYDPATNPDGFINLGIAENTLMHKELTAQLQKNFKPTSSAFSYGSGPNGSTRLRIALASFINTYFNPVKPVTEFHINVSQGVTSALERLAFELGDPGDKFLLGRPYYCSYPYDLRDRAGIEIAPVSFGSIDPCSEAAVSCYEAALLANSNSKVRAILLCNPHNPLGRCYPRETLIALMHLCKKYSIHLIVDEIYALSTFPNPDATPDTSSPFISALSIDTTRIINPSQIHTLWGLSKDLGANSLRIGCVISQHNELLHSVLAAHASYSFPSALLDYTACTILEDTTFLGNFITENQRRLAENYSLATTFLRKHRILFRDATAGCFIWIDLGAAWRERRYRYRCRCCRSPSTSPPSSSASSSPPSTPTLTRTTTTTTTSTTTTTMTTSIMSMSSTAMIRMDLNDDGGWGQLERQQQQPQPIQMRRGSGPDIMEGATCISDDVMRAMIKERVYLASGDAAGSELPGWFRLVFSVEQSLLREGLRRILIALEG